MLFLLDVIDQSRLSVVDHFQSSVSTGPCQISPDKPVSKIDARRNQDAGSERARSEWRNLGYSAAWLVKGTC